MEAVVDTEAEIPVLGFFEKLFDLLVNPWEPFVSAGYHDCSLCRFTERPTRDSDQ